MLSSVLPSAAASICYDPHADKDCEMEKMYAIRHFVCKAIIDAP